MSVVVGDTFSCVTYPEYDDLVCWGQAVDEEGVFVAPFFSESSTEPLDCND